VGVYKALDRICRLAAGVASLALVAMAFLVTMDVVWDLAFGRPIPNAIEIVSIYLMIAIVFLPMAFVEMRGEHIGADIISQLLRPRAKTVLRAVVAAVSVGFLLVMVFQTTIDAVEALEKNERIMGTSLLVIWPSRFSLPIGFALFALAIVAKALVDTRSNQTSVAGRDE
jgi:TRAP-type C4-dicarboxylate transport system permease small subunit